MRSILLCLISLFLFTACNGTRLKTQPLPAVPLEKLERTGFNEIHLEVFAPYCARCHRWTNTYANVLNRRAKVREEVLSARMPKEMTMPVHLRALVIAWIDADAPEFPGTRHPPSPPSQDPPVSIQDLDYQIINQRVITPYCIDCHEAPDVDNDYTTLNTFAEVTENLPKLRRLVEDRKMPPPDDAELLPEDIRQMILDWIDAGAPEVRPTNKGEIP